MKPETKKLLRLHDEDGAWEFPSEFDAEDIEVRARLVHLELSDCFGDLQFEDWICHQDASFGLAIIFKPYEKVIATVVHQPVIRFSNFGNLATLTLEDFLSDAVKETVVESLSRHGFVFIDAKELDEPYDGVMSPNKSVSTWWDRYFDWI